MSDTEIQKIEAELRRRFPNSRIGEIYQKPDGSYQVTMMDMPADILERFDRCTELVTRQENIARKK